MRRIKVLERPWRNIREPPIHSMRSLHFFPLG